MATVVIGPSFKRKNSYSVIAHQSKKTQLIFQNITRSAVAQSVEHATLGEEVLGLIPAVAARSLLVASVSL